MNSCSTAIRPTHPSTHPLTAAGVRTAGKLPAASSQLIVDVHQFQCNGYYPGRYHAIAFVPSPAGKMVPIDTGTRVYQEMYGASGDEVFETAKVCHMEPVRFDTRGYTGNVL